MRFLTLFALIAEDVSAFTIKAFLFVILAALRIAEGPDPTALVPGWVRQQESWGLEGATGKIKEKYLRKTRVYLSSTCLLSPTASS